MIIILYKLKKRRKKMSLPSIEEKYANWIYELKAEYLKDNGFLPSDEEFELIIDEGDFRQGED
jgi:hypothetical protein